VTDPGTTAQDGQGSEQVNITASDGSLAVGSVGTLNVEHLNVILQAAARQIPSPPVLTIDGTHSDELPFVGRHEELARLSGMLDPTSTGPSIAVITGAAGVGKTALARQAVMSVVGAGVFSHALYVDMRGYDHPSNRAKPEDVYASLLRRLGVPGDDIPTNPGEQARSITGGWKYWQLTGNQCSCG
jgi:hypothetical protein